MQTMAIQVRNQMKEGLSHPLNNFQAGRVSKEAHIYSDSVRQVLKSCDTVLLMSSADMSGHLTSIFRPHFMLSPLITDDEVLILSAVQWYWHSLTLVMSQLVKLSG